MATVALDSHQSRIGLLRSTTIIGARRLLRGFGVDEYVAAQVKYLHPCTSRVSMYGYERPFGQRMIFANACLCQRELGVEVIAESGQLQVHLSHFEEVQTEGADLVATAIAEDLRTSINVILRTAVEFALAQITPSAWQQVFDDYITMAVVPSLGGCAEP